MNRIYRISCPKLILIIWIFPFLPIKSHANNYSMTDVGFKIMRKMFLVCIKSPNTEFNEAHQCSMTHILDSDDDRQDPVEIKVNTELRNKWIKNSIEAFYAHRMNDNIPELFFVEKKFDGFYQKSIKLKARGLIEFPENSWLYLVTHSEHDDPQIGDITIAIDHLGNVYMNEGHICGGIIHFIINREIPVNSVNDFIENFTDDTEGMTWKKIPYKHKKTPKI